VSLSNGVAAPAPAGHPQVRRFRDVLYWYDGDNVYVLACDSNAGIGQRPGDSLNQPPAETGYSAAKVPLMEVLATGAIPFVVTNGLGGPRDEYGQQVLDGIGTAIAEVDADVVLTGSDETNVPTEQTAVGVTVIGRTTRSALRFGAARPGDAIVVVGSPKDGLLIPYTEGDSDIVDLRDLQAVGRLDHVHEMLPVGSRGIGYEAQQLAAGARATVRFRDDVALDLASSAGSSTCFLVALLLDHVADLAAVVRPPVTVVADIVRPTSLSKPSF
jgi:hypothetical protein